MSWQSNPYTIPLTIAVMISGVWAMIVWPRNSRWLPGKLSVLVTLMAAAWTMGDALQLASAEPEWMLFWFRITVLTAAWIATVWFVLALSITGQIHWLNHRRWLFLTVVPLIISILTLLDHRYHLIVTDIEFVRVEQMLYMSYAYGPALIVFALYAYVLQTAAAAVFVWLAIHAHQLHWRQITIILAGWMATLVLFMLDQTTQTPATRPRLLPLSVLIVFPIVVGAFNRLRRADFAKVARDTIIDNLPDPVIVLDVDGTVLDLNPRAEQVFNCTLAQRIGYPISKLDATLGQIATGSSTSVDAAELQLHGRVFDVRSAIMTDWRRKAVGRALVLRDISERKMMEQDLLLTQFCVDQASIGILRTGVDARILSVNHEWCQVLGYTAEELCTMYVYDIDPNYPLERWREHRSQLRGQGSATFESIHRRKDGSTFPVQITANYLSFENDEFSVSFIQDITEYKLTSDKVKASLHEKEILLKEIHHRVKNNLQIISSLLNLQSNSIYDPLTLSQLQDSQNRIRSMALIHERLYRSENLAQIDFSIYLHELTASIVHTYRRQADCVTLKVEASGVMLDIDTAISCGLIVNELVSNALKHAFPNERSGQIEVEIQHEEQQIRLVVGDDGVGIPDSIDYRKTKSLGLQLVTNLTRQLGGTLELCDGAGTTFEIRFPAPRMNEKR